MGKVTIKDVAKEAGVSISLVSFVMNNVRNEQDGEKKKYSVNEETASKILEVAGRLGYRPNKAASSLRSGRQYTIGVITSDIANHFFSDIARYIENVAYKNGYTVLFASTDESASKTESLVDTFLDNSVDGMIIAPCKGSAASVKKVVDANIPTVLIDRDIPEVNCGKVLLDNFKAGKMAAEHLISAGCRKIEMVNYTLGISSMTERELGYRKAMDDNALGEYVRVKYTSYGNAEKDVADFISDAVARGADAVIFPTNTISVLGLKAIHDFGIRVPEQLAVLCFDNNDSYDLYSPRMTRITQSTEDMAFGAFNMLKDIIENSQPENYSTLILEPEMICRESTLACGTSPALSGRTPGFRKDNSVFIPAASFSGRGGWIVDSQFFPQSRYSFLLAHGLGKPVDDAWTDFNIVHEGLYNVWVRTRNWTGNSGNGRIRGLFEAMIDGKSSGVVFGDGNSMWSWQYGGKAGLSAGVHRLALHDLTGFDGRCESVLLTLSDETPSGDMDFFRQEFSTGSACPAFKGYFDLVVYGGNISGICAAAAAARRGLKVALVSTRGVLGGDNSSEVRIGLGGRINAGRFPSLGYLLNEFAPERGGNFMDASAYEDMKKEKFIGTEPGITLFRNYAVSDVIMADEGKIDAVVLADVETASGIWLKGEIFADCMPGGRISALAFDRGRKHEDHTDNAENVRDEAMIEAYGRMESGNNAGWVPYMMYPDAGTDCPDMFYDRPYSRIECGGISNLVMTTYPQVLADRRTGSPYVPRACGIAGEVAGIVAALCSKSDICPADMLSGHEDLLCDALKSGAGRTDVPYTQVYDLDKES